jgi:4-amino-4-deoxy-L-arabinose transferase-like glycosyltransferase
MPYLLFISISFLFVGLTTYPLLDNNEGMYAQIGYEMLQSGNFIIPHLNGVPYIEKPPLLYYLTALSFAIFGKTEFAVRIVSISAAVVQIMGLLWFGIKTSQRQVAQLAALICSTSLGFYLQSHILMFDMWLTTLFNLSLFSFFLAYQHQSKQYQRFSYVFLALAILIKGFVAIILYVGIVGLFWIFQDKQIKENILTLFKDKIGILLFFIIILPWHIAASFADPDFAWFYFINEHILRFLGVRYPKDFYDGSLFYYVPRTLLQLFPWVLLLPIAWFYRHAVYNSLGFFLFLVFLIPFSFFSISEAKANYYMIITLPALAWLLATTLIDLEKNYEQNANILIKIFIGGNLLLLTGLGIAYQENLLSLFPMLIMIIGVFICFGLLYLSVIKVKIAFLWSALLSLTISLSSSAGQITHSYQSHISSYSTIKWIQERAKNTQIYLYKDFEKISSVSFYLGKLPIIDSNSNDLRYAEEFKREQYHNVFINFFKWLEHKENTFIITHKRFSKEFEQRMKNRHINYEMASFEQSTAFWIH